MMAVQDTSPRKLVPIPWAPECIELESVSCPVCGTKDFRFLRRAENVLLELHKFTRKGYQPYPLDPRESNIVQCITCGLVQVNPRRKKEDLLGLNNALHLVKNYRDGIIAGGEILPGPGDREMREDRIGRILRFKSRGKWLDIGCGSGRDLDIAVQKGFEGFGIELSDVKRDFYRGKKFQAFVGSPEDAPFPEESFDVITMWDVLEHVEDPNRTLQTVARLLKPDGIFVAKVPNYNSLNRRINGRWWDMYHPLHLYYFTVKTLGRFLAKHGLHAIHAYSLNAYGFGSLLKDIAKHAQGDPRRNYAALAAEAKAGETAKPAASKKIKEAGRTLFRAADWLPKQLCLKSLAGNFIVVYSQKCNS